jgi:hypothetical protein
MRKITFKETFLIAGNTYPVFVLLAQKAIAVKVKVTQKIKLCYWWGERWEVP